MPDGRWEGEFIVKDGEMMSDLIRCKDCIFYHKYYDDSDYGACKLHQIDIDVCGMLDYCSRGELREDD